MSRKITLIVSILAFALSAQAGFELPSKVFRMKELAEAKAKAKNKTKSLSDENATWRISDHRVIWMQLKLFP